MIFRLITGLIAAILLALPTPNITGVLPKANAQAQARAVITYKPLDDREKARLKALSEVKTAARLAIETAEAERKAAEAKAAEQARLAAIEAVKPKPMAQSSYQAPSRPAASFGGNCEAWIASAGITDVVNARELIRRESGCNPNAVNPSSGACGVAQELPCGKSGCSLGDGACQVAWANRYVIGRYGSWAAAVSFHNRNNWY